MPTIIVKGRRVQVSDDFFNLPHEDQEATIRQIGDRIAFEAITGTRPTNFDQPPVPNDEPKPEPSWSDVPQNIRPSAVNAATGLWDMITHPQRTAETLVDAAQGGVDRIVPEEFTNFMDTYVSPRSRETRERQRQVSGAVGEALYDRYGTWRNIRNTMITDPVGSALDIVGIATGAAGLVRGGLAVGSKANLVKTPGTALNAERLATSELGSIVPENNMGHATAAGPDKRALQISPEKPISDSQLQQGHLPQTATPQRSDLATAAITRPDTGLVVPKPDIILPDTNLVVPTPHIIRPVSRDVLESKRSDSFKPTFLPFPPPVKQAEIEFTLPRHWKQRSSPWIAQYPPMTTGRRRPFRLDYPEDPPTDAQGRILFDIERRPLTARFVAGRNELGKADRALTLSEMLSIIKNDLGLKLVSMPRGYFQPRTIGHISKDPKDDRLAEIAVWDGLPADQEFVTIGHELGHGLDLIAGQLSLKGIDDELIPLYSAHSTGIIGPPYLLPENRGYGGLTPPRERAAEAFRIYSTGPDTMKRMAPKAAAAMRELNSHPFFKRVLQFNGLPIGVPAGVGTATAAAIGAMAGSDDASAVPSRQTSPVSHRGDHDKKESNRGLASITNALSRRNGHVPSRQKENFRDLVRTIMQLKHDPKIRRYGGPR
ncbi:hypothetical protein [Taklimakanibacter albus]|uniref:Uncharacterized protein n=1 Tax=Taklimakanibacter albus TaxID=2800327 RepID=A0ACC5R4C8_9HYPH|nr:hypothetical protein [Aestuariivirga sp. YIM B02566]MBK1867448.1 hypothetical protein [Aestuariivirga sp. YIM B02566]